ncbi:hypothetical protein BD769DRAFT_1385182 [Suillus cothurnatus]|nr:hypothetical protein BD769DRAFT_1385182 [Suillus cothurnatus]
MTPPSSSYPFPTSPTTGIAPLYCSSTRQARYSQQPPNRYPTVTPPSSYPFPTSPITGIASLYCSSTRQACYSQQPSNGYPTMTPPSSSYPFPTSPMPDMATPHFSPTGQSTPQSSMIPPDVQLADNQYLLDIMSSFESRCPGQTDLPGLSILANHRELAPPSGTHFANSSSVNTATRSFGFAADPQSHVVDMSIDATINSSGASNGPQSFHTCCQFMTIIIIIIIIIIYNQPVLHFRHLRLWHLHPPTHDKIGLTVILYLARVPSVAVKFMRKKPTPRRPLNFLVPGLTKIMHSAESKGH